jgi:hypothetical protein
MKERIMKKEDSLIKKIREIKRKNYEHDLEEEILNGLHNLERKGHFPLCYLTITRTKENTVGIIGTGGVKDLVMFSAHSKLEVLKKIQIDLALKAYLKFKNR